MAATEVVTPPAAMQPQKPTLREMFKSRTQDLHSVADSTFGDRILKGGMNMEVYKIYASGLYPLYSAMEEELERHKDHPLVAPIYFPDELNRVQAIERDMEYFYGENWRNEMHYVPAIDAYVKHIRKISAHRPELLVPHSYVRYFGDLSGGQIIQRIIKRLLKFPDDGSGLSFYDFSNVASLQDFKKLYSLRLEDLNLTDEEREDLVQEARNVFSLNVDLLEEIAQLVESLPKIKSDEVQTDKVVKEEDSSLNTQTMLHASLIVLATAAMMSFCPWFRRHLVSAVLPRGTL